MGRGGEGRGTREEAIVMLTVVTVPSSDHSFVPRLREDKSLVHTVCA